MQVKASGAFHQRIHPTSMNWKESRVHRGVGTPSLARERDPTSNAGAFVDKSGRCGTRNFSPQTIHKQHMVFHTG